VKFNLKNLIWFVTVSGVLANLAVGFFPFISRLYVLGLLVCVSELWSIAQEASEKQLPPTQSIPLYRKLKVPSCQLSAEF
jgi:hypothetical protein